MKSLLRSVARSKEEIDAKIYAKRGSFAVRSPADVFQIFGIEFFNEASIRDLNLGESSLDRLPKPNQAFLLNFLSRFNSTFAEDQRLKRDFDSYQGSFSSKSLFLESLFRTLILSSYEQGVTASTNEPIITDSGLLKGSHDLVVFKEKSPIIIVSFAKNANEGKGYPMEQAFASNLFEIYSNYWKHKETVTYGCITDINSWVFTKYNGSEFFRTHKAYKLCLHDSAILSLSHKILNIIDSKL